MKIRQASAQDAAALLEIYAPIVLHTSTSFEEEPPGVEDFAQRITKAIQTHQWLVMEAKDGTLCGYAYAGTHRSRSAYRRSVETSVYVHQNFRGQGVGRRLYEALFESLATMDYHSAYAGIVLPNEGSIALHKALGFEPIGIFKEVGFKHGQWHDTSWWQRRIKQA